MNKQNSQGSTRAQRSLKEDWEQRMRQGLPSAQLLEKIKEKQAPHASTLRLQNRFFGVGSKNFILTLDRYCNINEINNSFSFEELDRKDLDALLIEGRLYPVENPWRRALLDIGDEAASLYSLIEAAQRRNLPAVLWITEEADAMGLFRHLFDKVDLVLVPVGCQEEHPKFLQLGPCVDVKSFNPVIGDRKVKRAREPVLEALLDGCHEIGMNHDAEAAYEQFSPLFAHNWWLTDSSYNLRNNNEKIHPVMRRRFIGSLLGTDMAGPQKYATMYFLPRCLTEDRPQHSYQRGLEAMASKTWVVTDDPEFDLPHIGRADSKDSLTKLTDWAMQDEVACAAVRHLGWRHAVDRHSYFEVLSSLLAWFERSAIPNRPMQPHVNIVVPTMRPDQIPFVLATCDAQIYRNFTITIVANGSSIPAEIERLVEMHPKAQLFNIPKDKPIGYCMNYGIDQIEADYWAKIDDDDVYGPHFLSDLLLQQKYIDFDVTGKSALFNYFEDPDAIRLRRVNNEDTLEPFVGGGTLLVKTGGQPFPEDVRGYADVLFLLNAAEAGDTIVGADRFNFIQIRRADPTSHTWTASPNSLATESERSGLQFENILI